MSFRSLAQHWPSPSVAAKPIHDVRALVAGSVDPSDVVRLRCDKALSPAVIALIAALPNLRELYLVTSLCSRVVHFGLAQNTTIDQLKVRWVEGTTANSGPEEVVSGAQPNGIYSIVQGTGTATRIK